MSDFFRFPHTPHLVWLGQEMPRDDKVLSSGEVRALLMGEVTVEEKLDGANLGFSLCPDGGLRVQNRGQYLLEPYGGQFARLPAWLSLHADALLSALTPELMLFGEWCAARHSLNYSALPDWFLLFDVYDRSTHSFWSTQRRNSLARAARLVSAPLVLQRRTTLSELKQVLAETPSHYRQGAMEGVIVRRESAEWCEARAKLVRADFSQAIDTHWRKRSLEWNRVDARVISKA